MELLDRYLQAIGKYLPNKRRDDIVAELRANLLEEAEEKESALGRPLTLDEEEELLKQHGRPLLVAARYLPQQYVIGPTIFPYWWFGLKTILPLVLLAYLVASAASFINQPFSAGRVIAVLLSFPWVAIQVAIWITVIAAIIEFTQAKFVTPESLHDWSPRKLPKVEKKGPYNRQHTVFEVIGSGLFILWLLAIPHGPFIVLGPGSAGLKYIQPAPAWHSLYWAFVAVMIAQWSTEVVGLFNSGARRIRPLIGLAGKGAVAVIFILGLRSGYPFVLTATGQQSAQYRQLLAGLNQGAMIGLRVVVIILALQFVWEAGKMIFRRAGADAAQATLNEGRHS